MSINFIVNDPGVAGAQPSTIQPSPNRPASKMSFAVDGLPAEQVYATDTKEFVAWQAREAALRALNTFESIAGPLTGWSGKASKKSLALVPDAGDDLNAYYNRSSVSFFEFQVGQSKLYSGASTDVVSHEVGHGILDALRPDLWNAQMFEIPAFHEGFGDCMAIMTALSDQPTRVAILQSDANLGGGNFVEAVAEELSFGVGKAISPNHNAAKPRHALNTFQWVLPQSLPTDGKPGVLINEIHSFGQLTSGCYYELIREIFLASPNHGEADLWEACRTATKLLAGAVAEAPIRARFLEAVGRTMILVDRKQNNGKNETFVRTAFQRHGVALSVTNFLSPRVSLDDTARPAGRRRTARPKTAAAMLTTPARRFLHSLLGVEPGTKLEANFFAPVGRDATQVVAYRGVDLTGVSERLSNVKAYTPYSTLIGTDGGGAAVLGAIDPTAIISREVRDYIGNLVARGQIDFGDKAATTGKGAVAKGAVAKAAGAKKKTAKKGKRAVAKKAARRGASFVSTEGHPTHVLRRRAGEIVIERVSFACGCAPTRFSCVSG